MKFSSGLYILIIACCWPVLVTAIPRHVKSHFQSSNDPTTVSSPEKGIGTEDSPVMSIAGEPVNLPTSGDSVHFFCGRKNYVFGSAFGSDIWGYIDPEGREYAIAGTFAGVAIINVTDDVVVAELDYCGRCIWKDVKTMGHYAYVVSECDQFRRGIMILDLQYLPDSVHYVKSVPVYIDSTDRLNIDTIYHTHSISIDTARGYMYTEGEYEAGKSIHIHTLADPENPVYVSSFGPSQIHDLVVFNDTA